MKVPSSDPIMMCDKVGCGQPAAFRVVLLMWATGYSKEDHPPFQGQLGNLVLCAEHGATARVSDVVTDEAFDHIDREMVMRGHIPPDRQLTELRMDPIQRGGSA